MPYQVHAEKRDIYQEVTDRIVAALEIGTTPWHKPWKDGRTGSAMQPYNCATGRPYNGINLLILGCMPYPTLGWLTFKQAKDAGGNVRKGERGTQIIFWKFTRSEDAKTGKAKSFPIARAYTVFNVDQCENLDLAKLKLPEPPVAGETDITAVAAKCGARVVHGGNRAFFSPSQDFVAMPSVTDFKSQNHYDSTLAHELTHWTGHESRLKRDFSGRFGNEAYAFEELVAEIGSAFVCARMGISLDGLQHDSYLASWLKVLKEDKRAIFKAATLAKEAATLLLGKEEQAEELAEAA